MLASVSGLRVSGCRVCATRYVVWRLAQFVFAWQERNYIRVVDLSWNGLGDPGAKEIGVYLAKNPEVTTLDISSNNFSAEGAISIAKGLKENTSLVTLRVCHPLTHRPKIHTMQICYEQTFTWRLPLRHNYSFSSDESNTIHCIPLATIFLTQFMLEAGAICDLNISNML